MDVGRVGQYRQFDTQGPWRIGTVTAHQDAQIWPSTTVRGITRADSGRPQHFDPITGAADDGGDGSMGAEERVTFDGEHVMIARCGASGYITALYEWYSLTDPS